MSMGSAVYSPPDRYSNPPLAYQTAENPSIPPADTAPVPSRHCGRGHRPIPADSYSATRVYPIPAHCEHYG